jgi:RecA-family ATPase
MNTKPRAAGPWRHQLSGWNPQIRWTLEDSCGAVGIDLDSLRGVSMPVKAQREVPVATDALASLIAPVSERSYHQSITSLAASMVGSGMFPGAVVQYLYALMDSIRPDGPGEEVRRWEARRAEIPRAVKSAEKFAPPERAPAQVTINLGAQVEEVASDLVALDWTVLEQTPPEAPEFLVDGWLPRRTTTLLSANGGVGKSNVALQLAVSMAIGADWLGIDTERSRVLILSAEDDARVVHFRVANICADSGVAMSALHNDLICYDMSAIDSTLWREGATDRMQWLADMTRKHNVDAVIIDNASDVFAGNENDRAQVRGFLRCLNQIAAGTDCAILLLAHVDKASVRMTVGKDTDSTFSGSTAWNNSVRSRWAMTREKERLILAHEKSNLGPKMEAIELEFDPTAKVFRRFGEVPGAAAARNTLRTARRREVLLAFEQAYQQDVRVSAADRANMNARKCVQRFGGAEISRDEVDSIVAACRREKLLEVVSIKQKNGSSTQYIQISPAGRAVVSLG